MIHGTRRAAEAYDAVENHEELIRRSRAYCACAVAAHGFDVVLGLVCWEVSTRAKRRAAAAKTPTIENASVGRAIDWSARANGFEELTPPECTMLLLWRAFESFNHKEWSATLWHEPVHVEQFQAFNATDHGSALKRRVEAVDVPVCVCRLAESKYILFCEACGADMAYRYRECRLVREPSAYRSACCEAPLHCRERRE